MSGTNKSQEQYNALAKARAARHKQPFVEQAVSEVSNAFDINPERYCLAALSEGMGETQARRFLAKCNIVPPTKYQFYQAQEKLFEKIEKISEKSMKLIRDNLPDETVFGLDCSWSAKRNASHAIVIFMDMKSHLIFDKVIVSRSDNVSDIDFYGPSNMMENAAVKSKQEYYKSLYKFIGFVHDFDINTAPCFQPDDITGQMIEYLDPGHLKTTLENIFKSHNTDNRLYQLKNNILKRFADIARNKDLSVEEKVSLWYSTQEWIVATCEKKGYLVDSPTKTKRRVTPEIASAALLVFLAETEWLIRKCGVFSTQAIESWNAIKAKLCPKHLAFQKSFRIRCLLAIEKWNDGSNWYSMLEEELLADQTKEECKKILQKDEKKLEEARKASHEAKAMKMRNYKRKIARIKNKIDPEGHQYKSDEPKTNTPEEAEEKVRKIDTTRRVGLIPQPRITNTYASNCYINSLLQLLRHTNPETNFSIGNEHPFVELMLRLNRGESLTVEEISSIRQQWSPPFSESGQEDVAEFYEYIMNTLYENRKKMCIDPDPFMQLCLASIPETQSTKDFLNSYQVEIKCYFECQTCHYKCQTIDKNFILTIPITSLSFQNNLREIFNVSLTKYCPSCANDTVFTVMKRISKHPEFLMIQFMRWSIDENQMITKDDSTIEFPSILHCDPSIGIFKDYHILGTIYHLGEQCVSGHYLVKTLFHHKGVATFDDARCYINPIEKDLTARHAYLLLYQIKEKYEERKSNDIEQHEIDVRQARVKLEQVKAYKEVKSVKKALKKEEIETKTSPKKQKCLKQKNKTEKLKKLNQKDYSSYLVQIIANNELLNTICDTEDCKNIKTLADVENCIMKICINFFQIDNKSDKTTLAFVEFMIDFIALQLNKNPISFILRPLLKAANMLLGPEPSIYCEIEGDKTEEEYRENTLCSTLKSVLGYCLEYEVCDEYDINSAFRTCLPDSQKNKLIELLIDDLI